MFFWNKLNYGLVCSGGGALGVAFLGTLEKFDAEGKKFDFYAGVSAGAIIVSLLALGKKPADIFPLFEKVDLVSLAFDFSQNDFGLLEGKKILQLLEKLFGETRIEDLDVPLFIGTTDFSTGEQVIISRGRITDAVRASISVPVFFPPYFHPEEKKWLVDGGLSENLPLSVLRFYKGKKVFALDTSRVSFVSDFCVKSAFGKTKNLRKVFARTIRIFFQNQHSFLPVDSRVKLFSYSSDEFDSLDLFKLKQIYLWGKKYAETIEL